MANIGCMHYIIDEIYLRRKEGCKQVSVKVINGTISVAGIDAAQVGASH